MHIYTCIFTCICTPICCKYARKESPFVFQYKEIHFAGHTLCFCIHPFFCKYLNTFLTFHTFLHFMLPLSYILCVPFFIHFMHQIFYISYIPLFSYMTEIHCAGSTAVSIPLSRRFQKIFWKKLHHRSGLLPRTRKYLTRTHRACFWRIFLHQVFFEKVSCSFRGTWPVKRCGPMAICGEADCDWKIWWDPARWSLLRIRGLPRSHRIGMTFR